MTRRLLPVPPRDPFDGGRLVVTRLENPETGTIIEGHFDLGWVGRLTREQLDFVGLLVKHRTNVQRLAGDIGIAYNTARAANIIPWGIGPYMRRTRPSTSDRPMPTPPGLLSP